MSHDDVGRAAEILRSATRVVAVTGAGVSAGAMLPHVGARPPGR